MMATLTSIKDLKIGDTIYINYTDKVLNRISKITINEYKYIIELNNPDMMIWSSNLQNKYYVYTEDQS